jgi:hypothetical protein
MMLNWLAALQWCAAGWPMTSLVSTSSRQGEAGSTAVH